MNLLLDTSTDYLFIALVNDVGLGEVYVHQHKKLHAELIIPEIERLLIKSGTSIANVSSILVTIGPGSFTGIRLALTVAKMIGYAKGIDVYALPTLQAYAPRFSEAIMILDARAERFYVAHYLDQHPLLEPTILERKDLEIYKQTHPSATILDLNTSYPDARACVERFLALKKENYKVKDIHSLSPLYLKAI
jgi:tRNA threonylcarbamoyladenosine biosynthesis protein TsaB